MTDTHGAETEARYGVDYVLGDKHETDARSLGLDFGGPGDDPTRLRAEIATARTCLAVMPGCPDCEADPRCDGTDCDDMCDINGGIKRGSPRGHRLMHEPIRHDCGAVLSDRLGNNYQTERVCPFGNCVLLLCPSCRRDTGGWGPVGCLCQSRSGHGTYGELRRPSIGRLLRSRRWRHPQ